MTRGQQLRRERVHRSRPATLWLGLFNIVYALPPSFSFGSGVRGGLVLAARSTDPDFRAAGVLQRRAPLPVADSGLGQAGFPP